MNYHTLFIGGGINNLVAAALLAKKGKSVLVVERTDQLGGCIRSEELEGCTIDTLSTAYPLFVTAPAFELLKADLAAEGVEFIASTTPTATVMSDKQFSIVTTDREKNCTTFNALHPGDGDNFRAQIAVIEQNAPLLFALLGQELQTRSMGKLLLKTVWKKGLKASLDLLGVLLPSVRNDFPNHFRSKQLQALWAPWILHVGMAPESPFSATMAKIVAFTLELVGLPLVKGGSYKIVEAFKNIIEKNGGKCLLNTHIEKVLTDRNKAIGARSKVGQVFQSTHVVASVTPNQLYNMLLKDPYLIPKTVKSQTENYKYGMGNMQIHLVLKEKPKWFDEALSTVTYTHFSDGIDAVSKAVNQAKRQILPDQPTICVAQPTAVDPSRATANKHVLWIQLPECPNYPKGDAAAQLNDLCQGTWTEELSNAYAERVLGILALYVENIKTACIHKKVISPKALSELNINLKHGDPYGGACDLDQYLLWRPLHSVKNHETPVKNLYHSGASTHPGPGLSGGSGFLVAQQLMKK